MGRRSLPAEGSPGAEGSSRLGQVKLLFWVSSCCKGPEVQRCGAGSGASKQAGWAVRAGPVRPEHRGKPGGRAVLSEAATGRRRRRLRWREGGWETAEVWGEVTRV